MYKRAENGLIGRYRDRLPLAKNARIFSLEEGNTPLIKLDRLIRKLNLPVNIYAKFEGLNPTGSFKDRGMVVAINHAFSQGTKAVICASTGNTSASAAAYAARMGLTAYVVIPEGKIALGKLAQALIYGARVIQIRGNFDQGMKLVKEVAQSASIALVNSVNPYRLQGQKTAAFEIVDQLGRAPDYHALPVGNAGNISAYWIGYTEYSGEKSDLVAIDYLDHQINSAVTQHKPIMLGYQAEGSAAFVQGKMIDNPETVATAIRIGHPQSWDLAHKAIAQSQGWFAAVTDSEILQAQKWLAEYEGIFCEPASAASIAGLIKDIQADKIKAKSTIVCTLTGNGLKDPDTAIAQCKSAMRTTSIEPDIEAIRALIEAK